MVARDKEADANALTAARNKAHEAQYQRCTLALRKLLVDPDGRELLWWCLRIGGIGLQPFAGDPHKTAFNCGELNVGQQILARILETEPNGYVRMIKEQQDAERALANEPTGQSDVEAG